MRLLAALVALSSLTGCVTRITAESVTITTSARTSLHVRATPL
jgi:hypothetical protein